MLHVLDGDATAQAFAAAGIGGDVVVWRELFTEGPLTPQLLEDDWRERVVALVRAGVAPAGSEPQVRALLGRVDEAARAGEEIVTWFDEDLVCRLHAAYFAARFPGARVMNATGHHARPHGLGEAFDARAAPPGGLADVWRAIAGADPRALLPLRERVPWLGQHLARFPGVKTGLDAVESAMLGALQDGPLGLAQLHARVARDAPGLTDVEVFRGARDLAAGPSPLVVLEDSRSSITSVGRDVLEGRADRFDLQEFDRWIGGVHLRGPRAAWRWDGRTLVPG